MCVQFVYRGNQIGPVGITFMSLFKYIGRVQGQGFWHTHTKPPTPNTHWTNVSDYCSNTTEEYMFFPWMPCMAFSDFELWTSTNATPHLYITYQHNRYSELYKNNYIVTNQWQTKNVSIILSRVLQNYPKPVLLFDKRFDTCLSFGDFLFFFFFFFSFKSGRAPHPLSRALTNSNQVSLLLS